jgi:predicted ATPase
VEARDHLQRALALFNPGRDGDLAFRFGQDPGIAAMVYLAVVSWPLGDVERAVSLVHEAEARISSLAQIGTQAYGIAHAAMFELMRGDHPRVAAKGLELARLAREHDLPMWGDYAVLFEGLANAECSTPASGLEGIRRGADLLRQQNALVWDGLIKIALAEAEARAGDVDRSLAILAEALATSERTGHRAFDAELYRVRGEMLLKRDPADSTPANDAYRTAIAVARKQGARSFELRAALALAKLYQSTGRPVDAHAVLAPALEGFAPTPEMPEIAEAQALVAALAKIESIREALEKRQTRAKMHLDYARAVQWGKGWGAEEARAAVERAHEFAAPTPDHPDYWSLAYGRFAVALLRGEFRAALEIAETYLRQAEVEGRPDHAVNARRLLGTVKLELGAFFESRRDFEKLLEDWGEDRDKGLRAVTGADVLCVGQAYMAQLLVILGEVDDAVRMSEGAIRRAESLGDFGSLAFALGLSLFVLALCGRNDATLRRAEAFEADASEKGARLWESIAREWASMARALITGDAAAATELRDIMAARRERQERQSAYMGHGVLARVQGKAGAIDAALASIAEAFALAEQTGGHRADSFLHRVRGDVLAERDPAAAEASYREALRIAQSQGARTFELQAAHALARLLTAAGRPADAHAVLAPALEGFAPTPEMPEIAEAQALLKALAQTDEVKGTEARRRQRFQLQMAYGNALLHGRGMSPLETTAAFAKAHALAGAVTDPTERFSTYYGLWVGPFIRGDLPSMREVAEKFLADAERGPGLAEAGVAHRLMGTTCWYAGDYLEARPHLDQALAVYDHHRDGQLSVSFGYDQGVPAKFYLGMTLWVLGEIARGTRLLDDMLSLALQGGHIPTMALARHYMIVFGMVRCKNDLATPHAQALFEMDLKHDLPNWRAFATFHLAWTKRRTDPNAIGEMRAALAFQRERDFVVEQPLLGALLAEAEAEAGELKAAIGTIDAQIALIGRTDERWYEGELHRIRAEILLKSGPSNAAQAENSFLNAIAVTKQQGARSFGLRASLSLAKLYQLTGRPFDGQAVLASAIEGFTPTAEMPEIAEAHALLVAIEAGAHVRPK